MTDQAHRLSSASNPFDSRRNSEMSYAASRPSHATHDSTSSGHYGDTEKDLPLLSGIAAGTAFGAGAGAGQDYSNPYAAPEMRQAGGNGYNSQSMAYQNVPSESYWPQLSGGGAGGVTFQPAKRSNKKWWIIGGVILGIAAIAGIVAGVVISQTKNKGSSNGGTGSSSSGSGSNAVLTNPNDPSVFDKNPNLHRSMWGLAYTPQVSRSLHFVIGR